MYQIRKDVFETNSSSTHAICIAADRNTELEIPENRTVVFDSSKYFGWDFCRYTDLHNKAAYVYAAIYEISEGDKKLISEYTNKIVDMLGEEDITCVFMPIEKDSWGMVDIGIDHGYRTQKFLDAVLKNKKRLMRFLFSSNSFIATGNDNTERDLMDGSSVKVERFYKGN